MLVMIGILLALQVNNWNENRKAKITEKGLLENMLGNLKADSISFETYLKTSLIIDSLHNQLYRIGVKGEEGVKLNNPNYIRRFPNFDPVTLKNYPASADKIKNKRLQEEILAYFSSLNYMESAN
jgi:hypothetical protein